MCYRHDGGYQSGNTSSGFLCDDCQERTWWMYMVNDDVWMEHARIDELLCYECFEKRLGRSLTIDDLMQYINNWINKPFVRAII